MFYEDDDWKGGSFLMKNNTPGDTNPSDATGSRGYIINQYRWRGGYLFRWDGETAEVLDGRSVQEERSEGRDKQTSRCTELHQRVYPTDVRDAAVRCAAPAWTSLFRLLPRQTTQVWYGRLLQPRQPGVR